jgi:hypothetical protein
MTSITTRSGKGEPLTHDEVDDNFTNLNADKLEASSNLSDVANAATARTNLGLGTAATTASTDYATAAQGSLADSALQSGDNVSALTNDAGYTTNVGDITGVTAGTGLTGGGTSGTVTLDGVTQSQATWEAGTGTTESLVSPAKVKAAIDALAGGGDFAPVAWADWNGVSSSLNNSGNVSSLSDYGTGYWGVNFSNSLSASTYSFAGGGVSATDATGGFIASDMGYNTNIANKTTSGMRHKAQKSNTQAWVDFYNNSTVYTI